jgi:acetyl-CoA C-acetyltransferase
MHTLTALQLRGEAGATLLKDARLGGLFTMGGAAAANYVSILERLR